MSEGLQTFLEALAFAGAVSGCVAGLLAGWRNWPPMHCFLVALAAALLAGGVAYAVAELDAGGNLVIVILGPLTAVVPTAAGFVVGRRFARRGEPEES